MMFDIVVRIKQSLVCSLSTLFPFYGCWEWERDLGVIAKTTNKDRDSISSLPYILLSQHLPLLCSPLPPIFVNDFVYSVTSSSFNQESRALSLYTHSPSPFYQSLRLFFPKSKQGKHVLSTHTEGSNEWIFFLVTWLPNTHSFIHRCDSLLNLLYSGITRDILTSHTPLVHTCVICFLHCSFIPFYQEFCAVVVPFCLSLVWKSNHPFHVGFAEDPGKIIVHPGVSLLSSHQPLSLLNFFAKTHPSSHVDHVLSKVVVSFASHPSLLHLIHWLSLSLSSFFFLFSSLSPTSLCLLDVWLYHPFSFQFCINCSIFSTNFLLSRMPRKKAYNSLVF